MAKLSALPERSIISGMKGVVDFYVHNGIPCARKWPQPRPHTVSSQEQETRQNFGYIISEISNLPEDIIQMYRDQAFQTPWAWRDFCVKAYIEGIDY